LIYNMRVKVDPSIILMGFLPEGRSQNAFLNLFLIKNDRFTPSAILELVVDDSKCISNEYENVSDMVSTLPYFKAWDSELHKRNAKRELSYRALEAPLDSALTGCADHQKTLIALALMEADNKQRAIIAEVCDKPAYKPAYFDKPNFDVLDSNGISIYDAETAVKLIDDLIKRGNSIITEDSTHQKLISLKEKLNYLSLIEIQEICFHMNIEFEDIPGEEKRAKVLGLIQYCKLRNRIPDLIETCQNLIPRTNWKVID
jgi:hypothetical protein